jgi:hypothetical protein
MLGGPPPMRKISVFLIGLLYCATAAHAQRPDLSGNWILNGGTTTFAEWHLTADGERRFKAYDFKKDDPALKCIGTSWTRVWLNPNVVVRITQGDDFVRLQYEWMDIDRRIPIVDPTASNAKRANITGMPGLGYSAAWYDGNTLVIDTNNIEPGYVSTMQEWAGLPQSRMMRTIERISLANANLLDIQITHVDPANYRDPLVVNITYPRTTFELMNYGCNPEDASVVEPR